MCHVRRLVLAVAAIALSSAPVPARQVRLAATGTLPAAPRTVLALEPSWRQRTELLMRLDGRTLKPAPGSALPVRLEATSAWSPGHQRLALAGRVGPVGPSGADRWTAVELRIVDPARMRLLHTVQLAPRGATLWAVGWLGAERVAAVVRGHDAYHLLVVNAASGAVERRTTLPGDIA